LCTGNANPICHQAIVLAEVCERLTKLRDRWAWIHWRRVVIPTGRCTQRPGGRGNRCSPSIINPKVPVWLGGLRVFQLNLGTSALRVKKVNPGEFIATVAQWSVNRGAEFPTELLLPQLAPFRLIE